MTRKRQRSEQEPDGWFQVGQILGNTSGVLATRTRLGRVLRRAVVLLSLPEVSDREVDAIRSLTRAMEAAAEQRDRDAQ